MDIFILIEIHDDGYTVPIMASRHKSNIEDARRMWGEIKSKQDDDGIRLEEYNITLDSFYIISDMIEDEKWYQAMMNEYRNTSPEPN